MCTSTAVESVGGSQLAEKQRTQHATNEGRDRDEVDEGDWFVSARY